MGLARRQRFTERSNDIDRYVGQRKQDVYAIGKDGKRLNITGTDPWSGGVGPVTNNEIFGGESMGADWTVTTSDSGVLVVGSRQAILAVGKNVADDPIITALHSGSGTQDVDGNLTCEFWAKIDGSTLTIPLEGAKLGFFETIQDDEAVWETDDTTNWAPRITNTGTTRGTEVAVPLDTWTKFKIIVKTGETEFYINDVLKQTLSVAANNPDDKAMSGYMQLLGGGDAAQTELRVRRAHLQYGT